MSTIRDWRQTASRLLVWFDGLERVTVAFSGGVDSALVLAAATRALGADRVVAATAVSAALPGGALARTIEFADALGVEHRQVPTGEMDVPGYTRNGHDRCYFCKATLIDAVSAVLDCGPGGAGLVLTGTNADDIAAGWRPGIRAAAARGAGTPLADTGMTKADVRAVARAWGLRVWDRPASPCLSSRVAYGIGITPARLGRIDRAESAVRAALDQAGITTADLRVRDLGDIARVEVDATSVGDVRRSGAIDAVRAAGFDGPIIVAAFVSGGLNAALPASLRYG